MKNQSIQNLIDEHLKPKEEEEPYIPTSWHVSKLGSCLTGIYLERIGVKAESTFDERTLRVFNAGKIFEDWLIDIIKETGEQYETQTRLEDKKLGVSGKLDLKMIVDGEPVIYEIKSKNSRAFWYMVKKGEGPMKQHIYQLWTYLYLTNTPKGILVYISKDDLCIQEYIVYLENKQIREVTLNQIETLNRAMKLKLPPPPPPKDSWQAKYCRWHKQCIAQKEYLKINKKIYGN